MIIKINREKCLEQYPKIPWYHYDNRTGEEDFFYPEIFAVHWLLLESKPKRLRAKQLASELSYLVECLGFVKLIFLGDNKRSWLSCVREEPDYKPLKETVEYLINNKIGKRFSGGLEVGLLELPIFFKHFYMLTSCYASLPDFHFIDHEQSMIGYIHFSGDVKIATVTKKFDRLFLNSANKTKFRVSNKPS